MTTEELTAILREVRDRVRARHPQSGDGPADFPLPDLMPLVRARDAAEGKVASIGTVNPRRGGPLNAIIQTVKKTVARLLDWHVREQVEFNRKLVACIDANLEAMKEMNRALADLAHLKGEAAQLKDIRTHWSEWRLEWERKLSLNEMQFLRGLADMQAAFQHRATLMESNFRDIAKSQHEAFQGALDRNTIEIQQRLWADLERIRLEYEKLIHTELRVVRQRAFISAPAAPQPQGDPQVEPHPEAPQFDYGRFAERFRGSEDYVREGQKFYLQYFRNCRDVLDIGCGRGEFLQLMHEGGIPAKGIEQSRESVTLCRSKGLEAEEADLFEYLSGQPDAFDGIFCAQVVEHLPPDRLPEMIRLAAASLKRGGVLAIETPNPECLAIFATHFYLDPTHHRPIPHPLLVFYLEEHGMGGIEVHKLSPAVESMPALATLPQEFREAFFGGLDYAIISRKLA
jgi:O-antigen chain-terminating methyltransferase